MSKPTSRAAAQGLGYNRTSKSTSRAATQEPGYDCMSKLTNRAAQEPGYGRTSKPTSRAAMQELGYDRTSKPTSRPAVQEPGYNRTSKPTSRAATQEPGYNRTSSRAGTQEPGYDRMVKPTSRQELASDQASELPPSKWAATQEPVSDQEHFNGWSDEDDSQDKEAAMLSPLKGSELRAAAKVCCLSIASNECYMILVHKGQGARSQVSQKSINSKPSRRCQRRRCLDSCGYTKFPQPYSCW